MAVTYIHLQETNYAQNFPGGLDEMPISIQKKTYVDAWIFNRIYATIQNIETYLITNMPTIEV